MVYTRNDNNNNNIDLKSNIQCRGTSSADYITKCIYNNQQ